MKARVETGQELSLTERRYGLTSQASQETESLSHLLERLDSGLRHLKRIKMRLHLVERIHLFS